jgi:uncharacterized iron-regulated membrane protein
MPSDRSRARDSWLKLHRCLALSAGLLFALMGLAGSLNVYREELDEFLNSELVIEEPQGRYQSLDRIMAAVRAAHPQRHGSWTLELPRSRSGPVTAWYETPAETRGKFYAPLMVSVNPYTAEVVASRFWGETAATWLFDLHTQFRLDRFGWNAVGFLGLAFMVSLISGLYLWWPGPAELRQVLAVRHDRGARRLALDLHRLSGTFGFPILLLLAFTGCSLVYPRPLEWLAGAEGMEHGGPGPDIRSTAVPNDHPVGLEEAVLIARGPFPHAEVRRVATPDGADGTYRVSLRQSFEVNRRHPATTVWIDRYSGQIREVRNPARFTDGETAVSWLWPLHTGEALGAWGRLLWFLTGLLPGFLYLSGLSQWLIRRRWMRDFDVDCSELGRRAARWSKTAVDRGRPLARALWSVSLQALSGVFSKAGAIVQRYSAYLRTRIRR